MIYGVLQNIINLTMFKIANTKIDDGVFIPFPGPPKRSVLIEKIANHHQHRKMKCISSNLFESFNLRLIQKKSSSSFS